nr:MAG TPA: tail assembly chaperone protein [Caudoviricetes sp.]
MSLLKDFLIENADIAEKEVEVIVSSRFKDKDGKILKFKIKPINGEQFGKYQKASTKIDLTSRKKETSFDSSKYNNIVITNHCVDPDFRDTSLLKSLNVQTPEQAISKVLLAGEIVELANQINTISGFDLDINDEIENAKN